MPRKTKTYDTPSPKNAEEYKYKYYKDYEEDWSVHRDYISNFDAYEAMVIGQVWDSVSNSIDGSKITDSYATTLAKERADRVIAKLPEGVTEAVGKADAGKAAFMDILRQKWIYPNANAQHPFFEKLNMWQFYSSVYGYMPMFYDLTVSMTGYSGPDCWLWNPRNFIPQQGRISIQDMDYAYAMTWVSKRFLENVRDEEDITKTQEDGWNREALDVLIEVADQQRSDADQERDTNVDRIRTPQRSRKGICLVTRYEAGDDGRWATFAPDHGCIEVRNIANPHKNGRIPFVVKYSQPLFDSFYGLGDFQRAKGLQFARDGLTNFYFKGIKMNLIPPLVVNANGVLSHTVDYREGAVIMETIPNSVRRLETSTAGLNTYQAAQTNLTASLLSLYGTQNASIPGAEALNPSQGKTPNAIDAYSEKEATRDGAERRHLQTAIEQLMDGMFSMVANVALDEVPVTLFAEDIKSIAKAGLVDVNDLFEDLKISPDGTAGELRIKPSMFKDVEMRFNMEPDSTARTNQEAQASGLERLMGTLGKFQNQFKDDPRIEINWPAILQSYEAASGVKNASEFVIIKDAPSPQEQQLMDENRSLQEQLAQAQQQQAAAAAQQPAPEPPGATITKSGHMFNDPELASVADAIMQT